MVLLLRSLEVFGGSATAFSLDAVARDALDHEGMPLLLANVSQRGLEAASHRVGAVQSLVDLQRFVDCVARFARLAIHVQGLRKVDQARSRRAVVRREHTKDEVVLLPQQIQSALSISDLERRPAPK